MNAKELKQWCQENGWTEPRQLEEKIWVAFPPNGAIENIIPYQPEKIKTQVRLSWLEMICEYTILSISAVIVAVLTILVAPYFLVVKFFDRAERF
jgi:hypothetical protein